MILVTGGAGFIGSHLVEALVKEGYEIIAIDNLSTGRLENLDGVKDKIKFYRKDILDRGIKDVLKDVEIIFHLAAQIDVRKSIDDPKFDLDVNGLGTLNLLEAGLNEIERFIYASSGGAVYGKPQYLPVDEGHVTEPISPYGVSKLLGEKYLSCYSHNYGLKTCSLRYGNVYGPRQDPLGEAGVISIFLDRIKNNKEPVIYGDGTQTRDFVHVRDITRANLLAIEKGGVYNVATGKEVSVNQLVEIFSDVSGDLIKPRYEKKREGEIKNIYLDVSKARKELKFEPMIDIREGIAQLYHSLSPK